MDIGELVGDPPLHLHLDITERRGVRAHTVDHRLPLDLVPDATLVGGAIGTGAQVRSKVQCLLRPQGSGSMPARADHVSPGVLAPAARLDAGDRDDRPRSGRAEHGHVHRPVLVAAEQHLPFDEENGDVGQIGDGQRGDLGRIELVDFDQPGIECLRAGQEGQIARLRTGQREDAQASHLESPVRLERDFQHVHRLAPSAIASSAVCGRGVTVTWVSFRAKHRRTGVQAVVDSAVRNRTQHRSGPGSRRASRTLSPSPSRSPRMSSRFMPQTRSV